MTWTLFPVVERYAPAGVTAKKQPFHTSTMAGFSRWGEPRFPPLREDQRERAALRGIAARRQMVFGSMTHAAFLSGRRRVSFDVCGREARLVAMRNEDADTYSIFVSQAVSAPPDKAGLLANDVRELLSQRPRR